MLSPRPTLLITSLAIIHICFALIWAIAGSLYYTRGYYGPTLEFPYDLGKEHLGNCGPSTDTLDDLIVDASISSIEAKERTETHGVAIVRQILTKETFESLRNYILKANQEVESTIVLEAEHRFHIMPDHKQPSIQAALKEIASHPVLRPLIDNVLGPKSSLVSFSVITNLYGSKDQHWHGDTTTSSASHPDYFVPEYTLAIPLQDTTKDMGATGICPGTHECNFPDFDFDDLETYYIEHEEENNNSYQDYDHWLSYNIPCELAFEANAGDGMLYNADVFHRGTAHTNPMAEDRAVAFLTFAASRQGPNDTRSLPLGTHHSLYWKSWGHTIDEFLTVDTKPWRLWHCFGFFSPSQKSGVRPWTLQDYFFLIFKHDSEAAHTISAAFNGDYFSEQVDAFVFYTLVATGIYAVIAPLVLLRLFFCIIKRIEKTKED